MPFTQVKVLLYKQVEPKVLDNKTHFSDQWVTKNVVEHQLTRSEVKNNLQYQVPEVARAGEGFPQAKKSDIMV